MSKFKMIGSSVARGCKFHCVCGLSVTIFEESFRTFRGPPVTPKKRGETGTDPRVQGREVRLEGSVGRKVREKEDPRGGKGDRAVRGGREKCSDTGRETGLECSRENTLPKDG